MDAIIFDSAQNAQIFSDKIDAAYGYPSQGVNIGDGVHVPCICPTPGCLRVTTHYSIPFKHPTQSLWAYIADDNVMATGFAGVSDTTVLDSSWFN